MNAIYFDYFASTPVLAEVVETLYTDLQNPSLQANPSSLHAWGKYAQSSMESAKELILNSLNLPSNPVIFTSSATESIHLAILGAIEAYNRPHYHLLSWKNEHSATLGALKRAQQLYDAEIHLLNSIDLIELENILKQTPIFLISMSLVQHELGIINDWAAICQLAQKYGCLLHLDASQAIGKMPITWSYCPDYITLPSHKCFGPKGIAALYIAEHQYRHLAPIMIGGGQQYGIRPGTPSVILIRAMSQVYNIINTELPLWINIVQNYAQQIKQAINELNIIQYGSDEDRISQLCYLHIPEEYNSLWNKNIMSSQGSACGHNRGQLSPALLQLGLHPNIIANSYRVSWSHLTTESEITQLIHILKMIFQHR